MNKPPPFTCPECGSAALTVISHARRIYINHQGERIPLLTVHHTLGRPVMEERVDRYRCGCNWEGHTS